MCPGIGLLREDSTCISFFCLGIVSEELIGAGSALTFIRTLEVF